MGKNTKNKNKNKGANDKEEEKKLNGDDEGEVAAAKKNVK